MQENSAGNCHDPLLDLSYGTAYQPGAVRGRGPFIRRCPLLALSRHSGWRRRRLLSEVKRTSFNLQPIGLHRFLLPGPQRLWLIAVCAATIAAPSLTPTARAAPRSHPTGRVTDSARRRRESAPPPPSPPQAAAAPRCGFPSTDASRTDCPCPVL